MAQPKQDSGPETGLKLQVKGDWNEIVDACEDTETVLEDIDCEDIDEEVSEKELENLREDWDCWKPEEEENYSKEMREKTAKQSTGRDTEKENETEKAKEAMEKAEDSAKKVTEKMEEKDLNEAKNNFSKALKKGGKAVNSKIKNGVKKLEEKIYEKLILKVNSLYFDNNVLNAVISKKRRKDQSEKYELTIHSNNPDLRKIIAGKIERDDQ